MQKTGLLLKTHDCIHRLLAIILRALKYVSGIIRCARAPLSSEFREQSLRFSMTTAFFVHVKRQPNVYHLRDKVK